MAGTDPLYIFGDLVFSLATGAPESVDHNDEHRWAKLERLGRAPARQEIGVGDREITFKGCIFTNYNYSSGGTVIGSKNPDAWRRYMGRGIPEQLITGTGRDLGMFVLLNVSNDESVLSSNGAPRKQAFTLKFARYGEDA